MASINFKSEIKVQVEGKEDKYYVRVVLSTGNTLLKVNFKEGKRAKYTLTLDRNLKMEETKRFEVIFNHKYLMIKKYVMEELVPALGLSLYEGIIEDKETKEKVEKARDLIGKMFKYGDIEEFLEKVVNDLLEVVKKLDS